MSGKSLAPDAVAPLRGSTATAVAWTFRGQLNVTVIAKSTFTFAPEEAMPRAMPQPILAAEVHHGKNPIRSVRFTSELAPYLGRADVLVTGTAHAPRGAATQSMHVRFALFTEQRTLVNKQLLVQDPAGFRTMPVVYERSSLGKDGIENPFGADGKSRQPNISNPAEPTHAAGFGPIAKSWPLRRKLLGSLSRKALEGPIVEVPEGFDWSYFQSAPIDQRTDYLKGDEWILLEGLHPTIPSFRTCLPNARGFARVRGVPSVDSGSLIELAADMLHIDCDDRRCTLVCRRSFPVADVAGLADVRIEAGIEIEGEPLEWSAAFPIVRPTVRLPSSHEIVPSVTGTMALNDEDLIVEDATGSLQMHDSPSYGGGASGPRPQSPSESLTTTFDREALAAQPRRQGSQPSFTPSELAPAAAHYRSSLSSHPENALAAGPAPALSTSETVAFLLESEEAPPAMPFRPAALESTRPKPGASAAYEGTVAFEGANPPATTSWSTQPPPGSASETVAFLLDEAAAPAPALPFRPGAGPSAPPPAQHAKTSPPATQARSASGTIAFFGDEGNARPALPFSPTTAKLSAAPPTHTPEVAAARPAMPFQASHAPPPAAPVPAAAQTPLQTFAVDVEEMDAKPALPFSGKSSPLAFPGSHSSGSNSDNPATGTLMLGFEDEYRAMTEPATPFEAARARPQVQHEAPRAGSEPALVLGYSGEYQAAIKNAGQPKPAAAPLPARDWANPMPKRPQGPVEIPSFLRGKQGPPIAPEPPPDIAAPEAFPEPPPRLGPLAHLSEPAQEQEAAPPPDPTPAASEPEPAPEPAPAAAAPPAPKPPPGAAAPAPAPRRPVAPKPAPPPAPKVPGANPDLKRGLYSRFGKG